MKILIGSAALAQYIELGRKPKDIDYFVDKNYKMYVSEKMDDLKATNTEVFAHQDLVGYFGNVDKVATLNELYTIKVSHIFWDLKNGSWDKHCYDIILMQKAGAKLIPELYNILYGIWEEVHGKKKTNLNMMPEDFFNKNVTRIYDHDSLHSSVAYYDKPMYFRILKDNHPVNVDVKKWEALSLEDKFKTVREEVYATALERQIIPSVYKASPRAAYKWALKKTITSFSKGFFALFIATHLEELWKPDNDYVAIHKQNKSKLIKLGEAA